MENAKVTRIPISGNDGGSSVWTKAVIKSARQLTLVVCVDSQGSKIGRKDLRGTGFGDFKQDWDSPRDDASGGI